MMLGMVLAALYASPTTVPFATPPPVPRIFHPLTEGYREGCSRPRIAPSPHRPGAAGSARLGGGQVAQIDDAAVLQARVQQAPHIPRDGVRVGQLPGGV